MDSGLRAITAFLGSVVGLAILSVILSNQSQTSSVIGAATSGVSSIIGAAVAPVSGSSSTGNILSNILGG